LDSATARLIIHECALGDGAFERTWLEVAGGRLVLGCDGLVSGRSGSPSADEASDADHADADMSHSGARAIVEPGVLDAVMKRYGRPLADDVIVTGPTLELGGGQTLSLLRHRARYDVIARDFLVYRVPGREPVAELAASVTAALTYLVRPSTGD